MPAKTKYKRIVCPVNKGPNHKVQPSETRVRQKYNEGSHIHVVPGITARTYTIMSEYMRYKYSPNAPYKRGRAHKI